jgi:hypothetical protein
MLKLLFASSIVVMVGVTTAQAQTVEFLCGVEASHKGLSGGTAARRTYIADCVAHKHGGPGSQPADGARPAPSPTDQYHHGRQHKGS